MGGQNCRRVRKPKVKGQRAEVGVASKRVAHDEAGVSHLSTFGGLWVMSFSTDAPQ